MSRGRRRSSPRRRLGRRVATACLLLIAGTLYMSLSACSTVPYPQSPQYRERAFHNPVRPRQPSTREMPGLWWRFMFGKSDRTVPPAALPIRRITRAELDAAADGTLYRIGHSTVLLKLEGGYWITDPVFSERASPVQWAGPRRFHAPAIALADLPPLAGVILSHDHYDHLDKASIRTLATRAERFITPLGVGDLLARWGVPKERITQLDWWQSVRAGGLQLTATPAQHFSGRAPFRTNPTLWASWVIETPLQRIFFSGDTGYFAGFREIGERFGPFDLTLLECGAYDPLWEGVHMLPEQSVQAHLDLRGRWMMPIHNGTFDLAFHDWDAPMEAVSGIASARGVAVSTPMIGEPVSIAAPPPFTPWWRLPR